MSCETILEFIAYILAIVGFTMVFLILKEEHKVKLSQRIKNKQEEL